MNTEIKEGLKPLFEQAREQGLWFYSPYQQLWFSPDELATAQKDGRFCWGAVNWQLRSPDEMVASAQRNVLAAADEYARLSARVNASRR